MSLVAAEGNAGQVCLMLLVQTAFTLCWAELNLTGTVKSGALGTDKGRWGTAVLEGKVEGTNGKVAGAWWLVQDHGVILAVRQMFPGFSWQHSVLQHRASCV